MIKLLIIDTDKLDKDPCTNCQYYIPTIGTLYDCKRKEGTCADKIWQLSQQSVLALAEKDDNTESLKDTYIMNMKSKPSDNENEIWLFDGEYRHGDVRILCIPTENGDCCHEIAHADLDDGKWYLTHGNYYTNQRYYDDMEGQWYRLYIPELEVVK